MCAGKGAGPTLAMCAPSASPLASWGCGQQAHARHTADGARKLLRWLSAAVRAIEAAEGGATHDLRAAILAWNQNAVFFQSCVVLTPLLRSVVDCAEAAGSLTKEDFFASGAIAGSSLLALSPSQAAFRGVSCVAERGVPQNDLKPFCIDVRVCTPDASPSAVGKVVLRYNVQLEGKGREHGRVAIDAHGLPAVGVPGLYERRPSLWPVDDDAQRLSLLLSYEWRSALARILHDAMKPQLLLHALALRARKCGKGHSGPVRRRFCTHGMSAFSMHSKTACACCGGKDKLCVDVALHAVAGGCFAGTDKVGAGPGTPTIRLCCCAPRPGQSGGCSVSATLLCKHPPRRESKRPSCFCSSSFSTFSDDEAAALGEAIQAAHNASGTARGCGKLLEHSSFPLLKACKVSQARCSEDEPSWFAWNGRGMHDAAVSLASAVEGGRSKAVFSLAVARESRKKRQVDLSHLLPTLGWRPNKLQKGPSSATGADECKKL